MMRRSFGFTLLISLLALSSLLYAEPVKNIRLLATTNVSGETDPCG